MPDPIIGLAASIEALRMELTEAMDAGEGSPMRFKLEPIELTLEVAVTKDVNGKIGWKVIEFGASREARNTQTLRLQLRPLWQAPDGALTEDFTIASQGPSGQQIGPRKS